VKCLAEIFFYVNKPHCNLDHITVIQIQRWGPFLAQAAILFIFYNNVARLQTVLKMMVSAP